MAQRTDFYGWRQGSMLDFSQPYGFHEPGTQETFVVRHIAQRFPRSLLMADLGSQNLVHPGQLVFGPPSCTMLTAGGMSTSRVNSQGREIDPTA
jgi:hypothetical protein